MGILANVNCICYTDSSECREGGKHAMKDFEERLLHCKRDMVSPGYDFSSLKVMG